MINSRQRAYLDAMEIGVWSLRDPSAMAKPATNSAVGLKLGPGSGGILLICSADTDSASRLASDISRALGAVPVWAWPDTAVEAVNLAEAVDRNLFTTVAMFGNQLAAQFFNGELPANMNSAKLVLLPSMADIHSRPEARRALWTTFCRSGMVGQDVSAASQVKTN